MESPSSGRKCGLLPRETARALQEVSAAVSSKRGQTIQQADIIPGEAEDLDDDVDADRAVDDARRPSRQFLDAPLTTVGKIDGELLENGIESAALFAGGPQADQFGRKLACVSQRQADPFP